MPGGRHATGRSRLPGPTPPAVATPRTDEGLQGGRPARHGPGGSGSSTHRGTVRTRPRRRSPTTSPAGRDRAGSWWRAATDRTGRAIQGNTWCAGTDPAARTTGAAQRPDRKSTHLNSSHQIISYAVFCLKKKTLQATSTSSLVRYFRHEPTFVRCRSRSLGRLPAGELQLGERL